MDAGATVTATEAGAEAGVPLMATAAVPVVLVAASAVDRASVDVTGGPCMTTGTAQESMQRTSQPLGMRM